MINPPGADRPARILIVDDELQNRQVLEEMLRPEACWVLTAASGEEAVALIAEHRPDLIVLDIMMPGMDGYQVANKIKANPGTKHIPIIMVTALDDREARMRGLNAGAEEFLSRPVDRAELCVRVRNLLRLKSYRDDLEKYNHSLEAEVVSRTAERAKTLEQHASTLRAHEARSAFALDAAGAGIWEVNPATNTTRWTEQISVMFGLPATNVETDLNGFRDRVHPDDYAMIDTSMRRTLETDAPYRVEFRVVWPDGTTRWVASKGRVSKDATGHRILMGIATDVTDRKELERQLHQAHKMESLGQFAGGIAHDFNNVLAVIRGFSELLLSDLDPADVRAADLREITKAATGGQQLTRQLLAFSRQQPIQPTPLDLNQSVTATLSILQQLVGRRVQLETSLTADGVVWADAGQVQQILMNLVANARDAMPDGGRVLITTTTTAISTWVAAGQDVRAGDYIVLTVSDNGSGMPVAVQERIFEPFFTTKAAGKGTGFGLTIVYSIVRQSDGFMEVASVVGEGTTLRIYLPRLDTADNDPERKSRHTSAAESW
jgi:PAS domain S-box-containing protein